MARLKASAALLVTACALAGCGPQSHGLTPVSNPSLYSVNQPVVQRTDFVFDVGSTGKGIPASEQERLGQWFETMALTYGDRVFVEGANGYLDAASKQDIARVTADYGLLLSDGAPVTAGMVRPGYVRVIVSRTVASVPGCPIWEDEVVGTPERTGTNYGCATNSNLAAMIADPNDLVLGQTNDGTTAAEASKSVQMYKSRPLTGAGLKVKAEGVGK